MKIAFVHQNMPAQYKYLARHFAADPDNQCVFITKRKNVDLPRVHRVNYETTREPTKGIHHYLRLTEDQVLYGQAVFRKLAMTLGMRRPLCVHHKAFVRVLVDGQEQDSRWVAVLCPSAGPARAM